MCQCPVTHDGAEEESYCSACLDSKEVMSLVRKMLADVDMLRTLSSNDDVVAPFDASVVILVLHLGVAVWLEAHANEERVKIDDLHCHRRCRVVFCLGCGQRDRLLELRLPVDWSFTIA